MLSVKTHKWTTLHLSQKHEGLPKKPHNSLAHISQKWTLTHTKTADQVRKYCEDKERWGKITPFSYLHYLLPASPFSVGFLQCSFWLMCWELNSVTLGSPRRHPTDILPSEGRGLPQWNLKKWERGHFQFLPTMLDRCISVHEMLTETAQKLYCFTVQKIIQSWWVMWCTRRIKVVT